MTKILHLKKVFAKIVIFSIKMSESKIFFRLTHATNFLSRNIGRATIKVSRKTAHDKVFFILEQKGHFSPKYGGTMKNIIALNLYIDTNVLVYERRLMVKVWSMTKFLLTQAPNTLMQICRNKGATKKASRKTVYDNVLNFWQKRSFLSQKMVVPLKQS